MKHLLVVLVALLLVCTVQAQTVRVDQWVVLGTTYANSAGDSITSKPMYAVVPNTFSLVQGQIPDSIYVSHWATNDSCIGDIAVKFFPSGATPQYYYADSVKSGAYANKRVDTTPLTVTRRNISSDLFGVSYKARASGNAVVTANKGKVYVRLERYFSLAR